MLTDKTYKRYATQTTIPPDPQSLFGNVVKAVQDLQLAEPAEYLFSASCPDDYFGQCVMVLHRVKDSAYSFLQTGLNEKDAASKCMRYLETFIRNCTSRNMFGVYHQHWEYRFLKSLADKVYKLHIFNSSREFDWTETKSNLRTLNAWFNELNPNADYEFERAHNPVTQNPDEEEPSNPNNSYLTDDFRRRLRARRSVVARGGSDDESDNLSDSEFGQGHLTVMGSRLFLD